MAAPEVKLLRVCIDGVDITGIVHSVLMKNEEGEVFIDLKKEFRSENGSAHRHLKGLQKAKD